MRPKKVKNEFLASPKDDDSREFYLKLYHVLLSEFRARTEKAYRYIVLNDNEPFSNAYEEIKANLEAIEKELITASLDELKSAVMLKEAESAINSFETACAIKIKNEKSSSSNNAYPLLFQTIEIANYFRKQKSQYAREQLANANELIRDLCGKNKSEEPKPKEEEIASTMPGETFKSSPIEVQSINAKYLFRKVMKFFSLGFIYHYIYRDEKMANELRTLRYESSNVIAQNKRTRKERISLSPPVERKFPLFNSVEPKDSSPHRVLSTDSLPPVARSSTSFLKVLNQPQSKGDKTTTKKQIDLVSENSKRP